MNPSPRSTHCIGLMSGTSLDGIDGVLARFADGADGADHAIDVLAHAHRPFDESLKRELASLNTPGGTDELHRAALAGNALARLAAQVVSDLLTTASISASDVAAIGSHGQTVRHQPGLHDGTGYTIQLNQPALLAERTGIDVVADFRSRDVAAGGQGAPLVPAFHRALFGRVGETVRVLNLGGIANLSVIDPDGAVVGFDTGPANGLMDHWCASRTGRDFDAAGAWAASGRVDAALLHTLLDEPYFDLAPPKSTGRDLFNGAWLDARLASFPPVSTADVQATLAELTAATVARAAERWGDARRGGRLLVCGGGAFNAHLMRRLAASLPTLVVESTAAHGLPPEQVEAAAFAWLAWRHRRGEPGNLASVTGARGPRILGARYPA